MTHNLKAFGLAVMAMFAMTAVAASAAQAVEFHSEAAETVLTAKNEAGSNSVFDAAGASISCTGATFTGKQTTATSTEVTVTPAYTGCTFLGVPVTVKINGCEYKFHSSGVVDVVGAACTGITFEGAGCKVTVGKQNGLKEVTYTNLGSGTGREVTVTPHVTGISYKSEGLCPKSGTFADGNYTSGNAIVTGENATGGMVGIWVL